ncbi:hypothetical protein EPA93_45325 [Ktedonosporobacter rubrisoli]|uniref:DUF1788 domain-containing protein n=1 Tax=Ktedonosporobacter rubrisoli TaxID=2509675 RepID=A0A4P6K426_KTERU|nr:hypothetical protein [Ktedonosporobacter rubrisoli]QBD82805.1 hypothetical protein EPA93_45325 [Ktedonosporobacter rubrisoli]
MTEDLSQRFEYLVERLRSAYGSIGHSSGRPYIYFVYPPKLESQVSQMARYYLSTDMHLQVYHLDFLRLAIDSLAGQEEQREQLLNDPRKTNSAIGIVRLWARRTLAVIKEYLEPLEQDVRPVIVLHGLSALHPLANPTSFIEFLAEQEPRHPKTGIIVPIVLLIPGMRPAQSSHVYLFLGQDHLRFNFYRGEEI